MPSKRKATAITPQIQQVLDKWKQYAFQNDLLFSPWTDIPFKAKVVAETGHCPCDADASCPCPRCLTEVIRWGCCWCKVFCCQNYINNPNKYPHETFEDRHR